MGTVAAVLAVLVGSVSLIAVLWHRAVNDAKRKVRDRDREIERLKSENRQLRAEIGDLRTKLFDLQSRYIRDAREDMERRRADLSESRRPGPLRPIFDEVIDDMFSVVPDDESDEPDSPDPSDA